MIHRWASLPALDLVGRWQAKLEECLVLGHEASPRPHHIVELLWCPRHAQLRMKCGIASGLVGWYRCIVHSEMIRMLIAALVVGVGHDDMRPLLPDEANEGPDCLLEGGCGEGARRTARRHVRVLIAEHPNPLIAEMRRRRG